MSTGFLVDQLGDTNDDLISIENGHTADRMGSIAGLVVDFFVKPWILLNGKANKIQNERKIREKNERKKKIDSPNSFVNNRSREKNNVLA